MLALLTISYALAVIDRNVIGVISEAIKADLKLTDMQIGLLGGISFALLYTFLGVPIARVAERRNRVSLISVSLLLWSSFTVLCGMAVNFVQLAACRIGVGFGEAGLTPCAHSLVSDYYEPKKRAAALSIYSFGITAGAILAGVLGGWLAKNHGWRVAFIVIGIPGIVMAGLVKLLVREPARGHSERIGKSESWESQALPPFSLSNEICEIRAILRRLYFDAPYLHLILGLVIVSFAYGGANQFSAPYFIRRFGLDFATVGLIVGLAGGISAGIGTVLGGFAADLAGKRNMIWYTMLPAIGVVIGTALYIAAYSVPSWPLATVLLTAPGLFYFSFLGPTFGLIQNGFEATRRATAASLVMFSVSLIGHGLGPPFAGWTIDRLATHAINADKGSVAVPTAPETPDASPQSFAVRCPGGTAPAGAGTGMEQACVAALKQATRQGIIICYLFSLWGALHFVFAGLALRRRAVRRFGANNPLQPAH